MNTTNATNHTATHLAAKAAKRALPFGHGLRLFTARLLWLMCATVTLGSTVLSVPTYYASLHHLAASDEVPDFGGQLNDRVMRTSHISWLTLDFYAGYTVALGVLFVLVCVSVGLVIFLRRSDDRMALLAAFTLVLFPIAINTDNLITLSSMWTMWTPVVQSLHLLSEVCLGLFFYLFPGGDFAPRWMRWLGIVLVAYWALDVFLPPSSSTTAPASHTTILYSILLFVAFLAVSATEVIAQIYRYRRVSTPRQRSQTKWVVFGAALGIGGSLIEIIIFYVVLPILSYPNTLVCLLGNTIFSCLLLLFPALIAIAILRSRLWDIDVIINRALVYGSLTTILAALYFATVFGLQTLLGSFAGDSQLAIVASTLVIAAVFRPLRRRIQQLIDRRFYRRKYDAAKTLDRFSATLRQQVDLTDLSAHLLAVVEETMQPAHTTLWLRPAPRGDREQDTAKPQAPGVS